MSSNKLLGIHMFGCKCKIDDVRIIGQRKNPVNGSWNEWTLVVCAKCNSLYEWQHHSEEQMHGGDLEITANVTRDYLHHIYDLEPDEIHLLLSGKKKIRRYNRRTGLIEETNAI